MLVSACSGEKPDNIGPIGGVALAECPGPPNCVTSQTDDDDHHVPPLQYQGPPERAIRLLADVILGMPQSKLITAHENKGYIQAEFTSETLGFVDDSEFLVDSGSNQIHVRSASRMGYFDLGANRERIERIRQDFKARMTARQASEE